MSESGKKCVNLLIGCTGSVASRRLLDLIQQCQALGSHVNVRVVATENATRFFDVADVHAAGVEVFRDADEWQAWKEPGDPVLHIELRRWAHIFLIAPLDANSLAKIANGLCDNLLSLVVRAWDLSRPLLFAPAMNSYMWSHPITAHHVTTLTHFGYIQIPCIEKLLMCGERGFGGMNEVCVIVEIIKSTIDKLQQETRGWELSGPNQDW